MDFVFFDDKRDCTDSLTHVYNREVTFSFINSLISENRPFSLCILDVDNFKYVNDGYGHQVGDRALYEISRRIEEILGDEGIVGRFGGDEFIIVLPDKQDYDEIWEIYHNLNLCTKKLKSKDLNNISMTVTMGSARFPLDATNLDGLFELADKALYRGKTKGRNCFIIYLKEKHANIDLKTQRDKVVNSTYVHSLIFNKLSSEDIKTGIIYAINYIGSQFMIDHLCLEDHHKLYFDYYHPICKKRDFTPVDDELMENYINAHTKLFYKNSIDDNLNNKLAKEFKKQSIYSSAWVQIKAHDKVFGYIRADIVSNPSGRIWQTLDIDVLVNFAHILGLELYYRNIEIEDI